MENIGVIKDYLTNFYMLEKYFEHQKYCKFYSLCYNKKRLRIDVLWAFAWRMFFYKKV